MNHRKIQILVSSFVDGEVDEKDAATVLQHLKECQQCSRLAVQIKCMHEDIRSVADTDLQINFPSRVLHSIEVREETVEEWMGIEPLARNAFIALAVFVVIMLSASYLSDRTEQRFGDQFIGSISGESVSMKVLFQQDDISKDDVLYAAVNK